MLHIKPNSNGPASLSGSKPASHVRGNKAGVWDDPSGRSHSTSLRALKTFRFVLRRQNSACQRPRFSGGGCIRKQMGLLKKSTTTGGGQCGPDSDRSREEVFGDPVTPCVATVRCFGASCRTRCRHWRPLCQESDEAFKVLSRRRQLKLLGDVPELS